MLLKHRIEYALTATMLEICRRLPRPIVYGIFSGFGKLMYHTLKSRRLIVMQNLEIVFPEKSPKEKTTLAKQCYANFVEALAFNTLMMSGRISNEAFFAAVEIEGWEHYEKALSLTDKGLLVTSAHIGNWELVPQFAALKVNRPLHAVTREVTNPLLEEKIVKPLRERFGLRTFHKKKALIRIMKALNKGEHAGLMIDQKLNPPEGVHIEVFGKTAPTVAAPALLQIRFGVVVMPIYMIRIAREKYRLIIREPIQWVDNGKSTEEQVLELTRIHQASVEEIILEYPEQWFWMHNRWGIKKKA